MNLLEIQEQYEARQLSSSKSKVLNTFTALVERAGGNDTPEGNALNRLGIRRIEEALKEYLSANLRGHRAMAREPLMFYKSREDELALILISTVVGALLKAPASVQNLTKLVGRAIDNAKLLDVFSKENPKLDAYIEYEYKRRGIKYIQSRKKRLASILIAEPEDIVHISTPLALIDLLIKQNLGLFEIIRRHGQLYIGKRTAGKLTKTMYYLKLSEESRKMISVVQDRLIDLSILYKPLVIKPKQWDLSTVNGSNHGGYWHNTKIPFVRHKNKLSRGIWNKLRQLNGRESINDGEIYTEWDKPQYLSRLTKVVNGIQGTKWRVNQYILDIASEICDKNIVDPESPVENPRCIGKIPYMDYINVNDLVDPEHYGPVYLNAQGRVRHVNRADYKAYYTAKEKTLAKLEAMNSKRVMFRLAINLAKEFSKYEHFYFSYSIDFRGRLYPIQQILNPQSNSNVKALLEFATPVIPTQQGLYWLRIAVANSAGQDKLTFEERIQWVSDNFIDIAESASAPLSKASFWSSLDEPLMFLSACKALTDGLRGLPVHFPVALDATCSGIQIYSGLLLDKEGAEAVNVVHKSGQTRPNDIYQQVADLVNKYLSLGEYPKKISFNDSEGTYRVASTEIEARSLEGKVHRGLVKRNVMTQPYSVTMHGMFDQLRELFDASEANGDVFWRGEKWIAIRLLVLLNSRAISEVVKGASIGQQYIKELAREINLENKPLQWETPIFKFPVIQTQTKNKMRRIKCALGKIKFLQSTTDMDKKRQSNAIAPNLIHSLDAVLMYLTVERLLISGCESFNLIHDSFSVPCNEVDQLNKCVRDSYVELFEGDPLEDWYKQMQMQVSKILTTPNKVIVGDLDLGQVKASTYIFN